jgi:hypothetical protein
LLDKLLKPGQAPIVAVARTGDTDWSRGLLPNIDALFGHPRLANVKIVSPAEALATYLTTMGRRSWLSRLANRRSA